MPSAAPKRITTILVALSVLMAPALASPADMDSIPASLLERAATVRDQALEQNRAWDTVRSLCVEVGPRFAGSEGDHAAVAWALSYLKRLGLENVRAEPVEVPRWARGETDVGITEPFPQTLAAVALGGSVGTPEDGLTAPVLGVEDLEALERLRSERVSGHIVYLNEKTARTRDGSGYARAVRKRVEGPGIAARLGARALVIRSVGTSQNRLAHTGTTRYAQGIPKIPAVALSNPDADMLEAQLASGRPVNLRLRLSARELGSARSANVIAEVPGDGTSDEIVLLAAHLDSWDLGTGAIDDGAGVAIVVEAARLISRLPRRPRRTIRVLLAANEEFGLSGAKAYAARNGDQVGTYVLGMEADLGAGKVFRLDSRVLDSDLPLVAAMHEVLTPLGISLGGNEAGGGADISPMRKLGMPVLAPRQDARAYFDFHHTDNDTLDKIDRDGLDQNVAVYSALALIAADMPARFSTRPPEPADH